MENIKSPKSTDCPICGEPVVIPFDESLVIKEHYAIDKMGCYIAVKPPDSGSALVTRCECGAVLVYRYDLTSILYWKENVENDNVSSHQQI